MTGDPPRLQEVASHHQHLGKHIPHREDPLLLMGRARFTDDIQLPGMLYAAIARSPHAHARIRCIESTAAREAPGVVGVLTGADLLGKVGLIRPNFVLGGLNIPDRHVLPMHKVHFAGEAVALVVAHTREEAYDALELLDVDYEPLPAVVDEEKAESSPQIHENVPNNLAGVYRVGGGNWEAARSAADHALHLRLLNNRLIPTCIEPRVLVADFDKFNEKLTLYIPTQVPHLNRRWLAETLRWPEHRLQIVAPNIGGGFGAKMHFYPEETLLCYASMHFGRPIKWTETRSESHVATIHGRGHTSHVDVAFNADGTVTGLKLVSYANLGAYVSNMGAGIASVNCGNYATGTYRIPNYHGEIRLCLTNTVTTDAYRGAGRPEAAFVTERAMDAVAEHLGMDPIEVRRRNMVLPHEFPHAVFGHPVLRLDSGSFIESFELAIKRISVTSWRERQAELRGQGRYVGIGVTSYVEGCGAGPGWMIANAGFRRGGYEAAQVRVHSDGKVTFFTGSMPQGQGHSTAFAQIVATELQLPLEDVEVVYGDTDRTPSGIGTWNSRSMAVGGSAAKVCAGVVLAKAKKYAALWLSTELDDIAYLDGVFYAISQPDSRATFAEIARSAYNAHLKPEEETPGLDVVYHYEPAHFSTPNGSHAAVVEVDVETGEVKILEYVAIDDCGVIINMIGAHAQVHGGLGQGIGQALYEHVHYDENGQLVTGSLMDYNIPRADQLPSFRSEFLCTPTETNPLGAKGLGEAGTCAAPTTIVQAVCDALRPFGIEHIDMPLTPQRVWRAICNAQPQGSLR